MADQFPNPFGLPPENQKHVCLFIHGYNVTWTSAMNTYGNLATQLFDGPDSAARLALLSPSYLPGFLQFKRNRIRSNFAVREFRWNWSEMVSFRCQSRLLKLQHAETRRSKRFPVVR